jgi:hypothetical protein
MTQTEADLRLANVRVAWSFADQMTDEQFVQLIDVIIDQIRRDARDTQAARAEQEVCRWRR